MSVDKRTFRLRKLNDMAEYGPMNAAELQQLVDSAYVSPEDEIATKADNWRAVTDFPEFGMVWKIAAGDGTLYGPTSLGTIREFIKSGEVEFGDQILKEGGSAAVKTVAEVLGEKAVAALKAEIAGAPRPPVDRQLEQALETARELRIRNLESDLGTLQQDYDELKHKYLKACEELAKRR
ncbi:MAG: DUF4339 domain-containing protein [Verrucomicrobiales bacterium]|jgi:hypothetical protein|nr:DUF4339 domain-containing protein [Verrucomicrobiales bacterium]